MASSSMWEQTPWQTGEKAKDISLRDSRGDGVQVGTKSIADNTLNVTVVMNGAWQDQTPQDWKWWKGLEGGWCVNGINGQVKKGKKGSIIFVNLISAVLIFWQINIWPVSFKTKEVKLFWFIIPIKFGCKNLENLQGRSSGCWEAT